MTLKGGKKSLTDILKKGSRYAKSTFNTVTLLAGLTFSANTYKDIRAQLEANGHVLHNEMQIPDTSYQNWVTLDTSKGILALASQDTLMDNGDAFSFFTFNVRTVDYAITLQNNGTYHLLDSSNVPYAQNQEGSLAYRIETILRAGEVPTQGYVFADTTKPVVQTVDSIYGNNVKFIFNGNEPFTLKLEKNGATIYKDTLLSASKSYIDPNLAGGKHDYTSTMTDSSGNLITEQHSIDINVPTSIRQRHQENIKQVGDNTKYNIKGQIINRRNDQKVPSDVYIQDHNIMKKILRK